GGLRLDPVIEEFADKGWKTFMPIIRGRPLLDYTIYFLWEAGFREICLVIGPEHEVVKMRYTELSRKLGDLSITFAIQERPLGTANAVYSARDFVGNDSFLMLNGDNLYPREAMKILRDQREEMCYVAGFEKEALIRESNFDAERIKSFAVMEIDDQWNLVRIIEKPDDPEKYRTKWGLFVNVNLWRFTPDIFWACERIKPHPIRGEYEITAAAQLLIDEGVIPIRVIPVKGGVLDLTYRSDIPAIMDKLGKLQLPI
ncbi:MAG: nucleotidyltransferase family protein, partial [Aigarchaeota archaeon]|nr:nucleotidyltransferase family protein [Aigarchaeota archaeon]